MPTKVMIQLSPSIWNMNWPLPKLTNSSLIFPNFTKNSRRLSFYPRNITNVLQIKIGFLLWTSKSVTEFLSKLSSSIQPVQQINSLKSISVLMRSLTKQVLYPGLSVYLTPCVRSTLFSMFPSTPNSIPDHTQPPPPPVLIDGEPEYEILEILNSKLDNQRRLCKLLYLVRWLGYEGTDEETSWLPANGLAHTSDIVSNFYSTYPSKPGPLSVQ